MQKAALFFLFMTSTFASRAETLNITASFWTNSCSDTPDNGPTQCLIPKPWGEAIKQTLSWTQVREAGQASSQFLDLHSQGLGWGRLTLFHVYPLPEARRPKYFQLRFEWVAPERGLCIESIRERKPMELPPVICSIWDKQKKMMFGVTLEFQPQN